MQFICLKTYQKMST